MDGLSTSRLRAAISGGITLIFLVSVAAAIALAGPPGPSSAPGAPDARSSARTGPRLLSPANDAEVDALPAFSWRRARGAVEYEFQLAADRAFESIVDQGAISTRNTYATLPEALADGTYYWRVRALDKRDRATRWSTPRSLNKRWVLRPQLLGPSDGAGISYPSSPLVLRWSAVPHAYKYLVRVSTDPSLSTNALTGYREEVETSGTVFSPQEALPSGRYYWAVTPLNGQRHRGARSVVGSFVWSWPTQTATRVDDLNSDARVYDPQLSWDPVPGAAQYDVEVSASSDFAPGSAVCCDGTVTGTSTSPTKVLANNTYYWRIRARDVDGNAGAWNIGPSFRKDFDAVSPTIPNLHMRDHANDPAAGPGTPTLQTPIIDWDPVPGASSYEVQVVPYVSGACDWTSLSKIDVKTATTAWTPLGFPSSSQPPGGVSFPRVARDARQLVDGTTYCARVLARSDRDQRGGEVVSDWTQVGGLANPAFTYDPPAPAAPPPGQLVMPAGNYRLPQAGTVSPRMPLFTWSPVPGAGSYYVVVAKDPSFTNVVDVAFTNVPAYAPRDGTEPHTYPDETTSYYWAVMPAKDSSGGQVTTQPTEDNPRPFQKRSTPPSLLAPGDGAVITTQPSFRWSSAEGARSYQLQVAQEPNFGEPIDNVTTASTAYTSKATYPADTMLYWRVRATDEDGVGLTWSRTGTIHRRLPVPQPAAGTPTDGETIPVLSWTPVQGAVSYQMRVDQSDGTTRDFTMRSSAFTPVIFYGTGVWRWQVRANFKSGAASVSGGYFESTPFTRRIGTPAGAHGSANGGALVSWEPSPMAKSYRVQISATNSFRSVIETVTTDHTSFAPRLPQRNLRVSRLYWRVAVVDEGNNVGGFASGRFVNRQLHVRVSGRRLRPRRQGIVRVRVTDERRRPVKSASVRVTGVARAKPRRTNRRGVATFRLRPTRKGRVVFRAVKRRYQPGRRSVRVR